MLEYALFLTMSQPAPVIGQVIPSGLLYSYAKKADTKSPIKLKEKIDLFKSFILKSLSDVRQGINLASISFFVWIKNIIWIKYFFYLLKKTKNFSKNLLV